MERNSITYDENWQSVTEREYPEITTSLHDEVIDEPHPAEAAVRKVSDASSRQLLVTLQLIFCVLLGLAAFVLKSVGGEVYQTAREWYYRQLNSSIIFEGNGGFDVQKLLNPASADEAAD